MKSTFMHTYGDLIKTYIIKYDIRKFYGLSINEFLDMPGWKDKYVDRKCWRIYEGSNTDLNDIRGTINNKNKNIGIKRVIGIICYSKI